MSRLLCDTTLRYSVGQKGIEGFARQPYAGKLHVRFDEGVGVPHGGFVATSQFPTYSSGGGGASPSATGGKEHTKIRTPMRAYFEGVGVERTGGGQAQRVSDDQTSIRLCMMARMRI